VRYTLPAWLIAATPTRLWVTTTDGGLIELDPATGPTGRRVELPAEATDVVADDTAVWVSSTASDLLRVDVATLATATVPASAGGRLVLRDGVPWIGSDGAISRVDPATLTVAARLPVTGYRADLGFAFDDTSAWVATVDRVARIDPPTGAELGSVPGDASEVAIAAGDVWATRGTELLRIDPATLDATIAGRLPSAGPLAATAAALFVAGPPGSAVGRLLEVDVPDASTGSETTLPVGVVDLAVSGDAAWLTFDDGSVRRFDRP
jgi:DNA-binding beta-propeller fold protein YncE